MLVLTGKESIGPYPLNFDAAAYFKFRVWGSIVINRWAIGYCAYQESEAKCVVPS